MAAPAWDLFVVYAVGLTVAVVVLARRTARFVGTDSGPIADLSRSALYLNVAVSHGVVLGLLGLGLWWTAIPLQSLGLGAVPQWHLLLVVALSLIVLNELADHFASALDTPDNPLRELLTPRTPSEWLLLVGVVLPAIAVTEELLFRGVLIGAFEAGTPVPIVGLIFGSAVLFGGAHTAQGWLGVGIATLLGVALGAVFYWTGSLWLVIGVHFLVDLVEFVRHAGDEAEPDRPAGSARAGLQP